ncbi:putative membrane protein [Candidatus Zixiibacteriota bacterium]|nr:putative membrane protein [candidate division Zixibacteria bacterium]
MVKKKDSSAGHSNRPGKTGWDPENFKYYFPAVITIMLVGVILLFRDFIFSDQMLSGSDMINAGIFFRHFYVEYVKLHGSIPLWNPYIFGGMPFIDAFHGDIFYPLSILKFTGNFFRMLGMNLVIHIFLSGIFMYLTARQFKLSRVASTVSGFAYMFSGLLVSLVAPGHDGKIFVITLFPLTMLFLERAFEKKPILNFALLGLVIGVIILSPHAQLSYYALWAIALYGLFKLIFLYRQSRSLVATAKPAGYLVAAVIIGLAISAIQFYPGYIYTTKYSPRADTKRGYDWATSWSMHPEEAFSLVVPEFAGVDSGRDDHYWGKNFFKDNSEYAGVITLFLGLLGLLFSRRKEAYFFGGLALFALIYALGDTTPLFKIFYYVIPNVKSLRAPSTIMFLFLFSMALLAGIGIQFLTEKGRELSALIKKRMNLYLLLGTGLLIFFALLFSIAGEGMLSFYSSIFYSGLKSMPIGQGNVTKWQVALMNLPNIKTGFWVASFLIAATATAIALYLSRKVGRNIFLILPLLIMIDGFRFDSRFIKTYDYRQQFTPSVISNYIKTLPGHFRVMNMQAVPDDYLPYFDIEVVVGYHGNQLRWYDDLLGGPAKTNLGNPNFLNLVGARYILGRSGMRDTVGYFGPNRLTVEKDFGAISLYRNDNALPRAFLVNRFEVVPERKNIYPLVLSGQSDLRKKVFLEETPPLDINAQDTLLPPAEITSHAVDSVVVEFPTLTSNTILVLTDNYYVAWEAFASGAKVPILRADGAFRAVALKAGTNRVIFKYNKAMNNRGLMITLFGLIIVGAVLSTYGIQSLMRRKKDTHRL